MKQLIFTLIGEDKPGLVESIAQTVYELNGNWLSSNFAHMAGNFAGFVQIELPSEKEQDLLESFAKHPDLRILLASEQKAAQVFTQSIQIDITSNDRAGIVQELTQVLSTFDLNITSFTTSCESAPNWGGNIFKAHANVALSDNYDIDSVRDALEELADDLVVDITKESTS